MKFMKLGSKPDSFQSDGDNNRYVASELATDIVVRVGETKFHLHKFPLLSKSGRLQKLVASTNEDEVHISDLPGGPTAFEICAKFCYGMTVTLNAYNVVSARCAAEYLAMDETLEKGNLIYKIDVFLTSSVLRSWKDSIICLQTTKCFLPLSEDLKLVTHCVDAVASKASVDVSKVNWSYTYSSKKLPEENGNDLNGFRTRTVPKDWWVEDLCELEIDLYKRVMTGVKNRGLVCGEVIGEALKAYANRKLAGFNKGIIEIGDTMKGRYIVDTIAYLFPSEKGCVSCGFLLRLLKAANLVNSSETMKMELVKRIGQQLEGASVNDLLIRAQEGEKVIYDVAIVKKIIEEFITQDQDDEIRVVDEEGRGIEGISRAGILSEASKLMVAKVVDGYLTEIAKDPNLPLSMFVGIAELVSGFNRPGHDGLYRAIDTYLKEHPGTTKSERKKICKLMDCKKLSAEACTHAVQNERLPMRVIVQVLFFEQVRAAAASSGSSTPDLPKGIIPPDLRSHGSSRSVRTATDEDWDAVATADELRALRAEVAALRVGGERERNGGGERKKVGAVLSKRILSKIWSRKNESNGNNNNSGSDSSESRNSGHPEMEAKLTPSRNRRNSVS